MNKFSKIILKKKFQTKKIQIANTGKMFNTKRSTSIVAQYGDVPHATPTRNH